MEKLKLLSLFSGIGAFEKALDRLGVAYDLEGYSEIDKYASQAYALIHDTEEWMNLGDITKIDETKLAKDIDLITYGFPCQDISLAGNQKGLTDEEGNKTRSGLVWDATRIIREAQPKVAIAENVKNLVSKKFTKEFEAIQQELEDAGYNNYWQVLNAKEHGIAQNRERVFLISIRKDIDLGLYEWPEPEELKTRLIDYLEDEVDEKYYLSDKQVKSIQESTFQTNARRIHAPNGIIGTLCARDYKDPKCVDLSLIQVGQMYGTEKEPNPQAGRSSRQRPELKDFIETDSGIVPTLTTRPDTLGVVVNQPSLRIRKLTPKEYWRLMGFDDEDHVKVEKAGISNSQRYKMAGNSIVVNVVAKMLKNLIESVL